MLGAAIIVCVIELSIWDEMNNVGVRSNFVAIVYAAELMLKQKQGLIVNISFYASRKYYGNVIYGIAKRLLTKCQCIWQSS